MIYAYIARRSPDGAQHWDAALDRAIEQLTGNPNICSRIPERVVCNQEIKQLLFKTKYGNRYRIVFAIEDDLVTILRIRGPGQPPINSSEIPGK